MGESRRRGNSDTCTGMETLKKKKNCTKSNLCISCKQLQWERNCQSLHCWQRSRNSESKICTHTHNYTLICRQTDRLEGSRLAVADHLALCHMWRAIMPWPLTWLHPNNALMKTSFEIPITHDTMCVCVCDGKNRASGGEVWLEQQGEGWGWGGSKLRLKGNRVKRNKCNSRRTA